jgi:hypothetical protein
MSKKRRSPSGTPPYLTDSEIMLPAMFDAELAKKVHDDTKEPEGRSAKILIRVPPNLHDALNHLSATEARSVKDLLLEAARELLAKRER